MTLLRGAGMNRAEQQMSGAKVSAPAVNETTGQRETICNSGNYVSG